MSAMKEGLIDQLTAAQLLSVSRVELLELMSRAGLAVIDYDDDELEAELEAARRRALPQGDDRQG